MSNVDQFKSRAQLEVFLSKNPKGFLESLEQNQSFRGNFRSLLEQWNTSDIIQLATLLQSKEYRDPITNKLRIAETEVMATHFTKWANKELNAIELNPHHQMGYLQEYIKEKEAQQQEIEHRKQQAKKAQEREALEEKDSNDKKQQIGIQLQILAAQASLHQAFQQLFKGMANNGASFASQEMAKVFQNYNPQLYAEIQRNIDPEGKLSQQERYKKANLSFIALEAIKEHANKDTPTFKNILEKISDQALALIGINRNNPNWQEQFIQKIQDPMIAAKFAPLIVEKMDPKQLPKLMENTEIGKIANPAIQGKTEKAEQAAQNWSKEAQKVNYGLADTDKRIENTKNEKSVLDSWENIINQNALEDANATHKAQHEVNAQVPEQQQINNKKDTMGIG